MLLTHLTLCPYCRTQFSTHRSRVRDRKPNTCLPCLEEAWRDMDIAESYIDAQKDAMYEAERMDALCRERL